MLQDLQCDEMQGFLFSPARTSEDIRALLQTNQIGEFVRVG
jgi:EAL domain-containing protein (putative c-di-GMP-specific phosphodiesterase class I)